MNSKIKMVAYSAETKRFEEIHIEDECPVSDMIPMFMGDNQQYYTVPGCTAEMVYSEWLAQH